MSVQNTVGIDKIHSNNKVNNIDSIRNNNDIIMLMTVIIILEIYTEH